MKSGLTLGLLSLMPLGVRNNFDKFLQELADHPLFPEAEQVNIEKLRQVPRFVEKKMKTKMSSAAIAFKMVANTRIWEGYT